MRSDIRRFLLPFGFALVTAIGCGGRTGVDGLSDGIDAGAGGFFVSSGGDSSSGGHSGAASSGGRRGRGGAGGRGAGGSGGSFGGTTSAGGAPGCEFPIPCPPPAPCAPGYEQATLPGQCCSTCQPCPPIACVGAPCGPGQQLETLPGQCCPTCVTVDPCAGVACDLPLCPPGWITVTPPGQCCPSCEPSPVDASIGPCDTLGYVQFLSKELLALDAASCSTAADCTMLPPSSACGQSNCGSSVNAKAAQALTNAASQFAASSCWGCPPTAGGNCPVYVPLCAGGQCTYTAPP